MGDYPVKPGAPGAKVSEEDLQRWGLVCEEATPEDAEDLAAFHARIARNEDPDVFFARSADFFRSHAGEQGWTIVYRLSGRIIGCCFLSKDISSHRENWYFPRERQFLTVPTVWAGGYALEPEYRGGAFSERIREDLADLQAKHGALCRLAMRHPRNMKRLQHFYRHSIVCGLYYDYAGWNFLSIGSRLARLDAVKPRVYAPLYEEQVHKDLLGQGLLGISVEPRGDGLVIGYS
jgi:hypothetical protein